MWHTLAGNFNLYISDTQNLYAFIIYTLCKPPMEMGDRISMQLNNKCSVLWIFRQAEFEIKIEARCCHGTKRDNFTQLAVVIMSVLIAHVENECFSFKSGYG